MKLNDLPIPPQIPTASRSEPDLLPLGANPEENERIPNLVAAVEAILRQPRRVMAQLRQPGASRLIGTMFFGVMACSIIYGAVVGSFSMGSQVWAAPVKISLGLLLTSVICLPSLYIFVCISGARVGLQEICGLVTGLLMLMTVLLIGFAPVAWLFSQSTESIAWIGTLHLLFWFIATSFGLRFLTQGFSHFQARSKAGLNTWMVMFVLVAIQMTTALRPIVGKADSFLPANKEFFIKHWSQCLRATSADPR